jgi:hypothetical protein
MRYDFSPGLLTSHPYLKVQKLTGVGDRCMIAISESHPTMSTLQTGGCLYGPCS